MVEVVVATALVTVGLLALISGFQYAISGVATGGGETAAVFLAEQRIEQLRAQAMRDFMAPALAAGTMTDYCVAGHVGGGASACQDTAPAGLGYTRSTRITDLSAVAGCPTTPVSCKQVEVRVSYRPVTSTGRLDQSRSVDVVTVLGPRA